MAKTVSESPLLGSCSVHVIPNGVDTALFAPRFKAAARETLSIPPDAAVILFSAESVSERRKGYRFFREAMERLRPGVPDLRAIVVGGATDVAVDLGIPSYRMPRVDDDRMLATVYSAADVFVFPALAENSPNAVLESMACGTPVVAFDVGGVGEMVEHMDTGYLARLGDAADLAAGIDRLLADGELLRKMTGRSRHVAETDFPATLEARRFLELYGDLVAVSRRGVA